MRASRGSRPTPDPATADAGLVPAPPGQRRSTRSAVPSSFSALRYRNFQLLWFGNFISNTGDWMDQISFNWLVYSLTDSAIWLAVMNLCRFVPILVFTLVGGVIADRFERRRMMFVTQTVAMILAIALAALVATGHVQLWMVMLIAFGRGVMNSFNQPAKQSLVSDLVPPHELRNAIALNSAQFNLTRVIGPAIGGALIATIGVEGAFIVNGASFVAVLGALALMQFPERKQRPPRAGIMADLLEGVRYLRRTPTLGMLVLLALIPIVLGNPYMTMLTVFARDVLFVGGGGLGALTAASAVGSVIGALIVGMIAIPRRGRLMLTALVAFGGALVLFAASTWLPVSLLALCAAGIGQQTYLTLNNSVVQETVEEEYRGRVLSMMFLNRGMVPLGTMIAGLATTAVGPQWAIGCMAAALILLALGVARFAPAVRELR